MNKQLDTPLRIVSKKKKKNYTYSTYISFISIRSKTRCFEISYVRDIIARYNKLTLLLPNVHMRSQHNLPHAHVCALLLHSKFMQRATIVATANIWNHVYEWVRLNPNQRENYQCPSSLTISQFCKIT